MGSEAPMRPENVRWGTGRYDPKIGSPQFSGLTQKYEVPVGPATAQGYAQKPGTRIEKVRYSHDALIDAIVANPRVTQNELAITFGYSVSWISRIIGSDAFQAALAKRREEVTDPFLVATVEERLRGLANQSLDVIAEKLEATKSADIALKALDISSKALGFGARERAPANVQNNFVVQMPAKAPSAEDWAASHSPLIESRPLSSTISRDPLIQPDSMKTVEE